jgi:hypothetical protein
MKKKILSYLAIFALAISVNSQTTFATVQNIDPNVSPNPYAISSGDLDGDTFIDIVIGTYNFSSDFIRWYKNDGTGNFTQQTVISNSAGLQGIGGLAIADLDGINGNDIIVGSYSGKVVWFANDGLGGFGSEQLIGNLAGTGQVVVADVNNDGDIDVAAVGYDANKVVWYAGDGTGSFGTEQLIEDTINFPGLNTQPGNINFVDFDGDTDLDAVVGYIDGTTSGTIEIYYNQYIESGTMTVSWLKDTVTVNSGNPFLFVTAFADVDNDGALEIIKSDNTSGDVAYYDKIKNGSSTETIIQDETIIDRPAVTVVTDLDNDTFNDVIVTDGGTVDDSIIWFKGNSSAAPDSTESLIADNNHQIFALTVADFDGDGDKDIATVGYQSDTLDWYENEWDSLGLDDNEINPVSIFPNPTKNMLNFKVPFSEAFNVSVYDILGKKVINASISSTKSLDVSNLKSGIYILKFNEHNTILKFVKE